MSDSPLHEARQVLNNRTTRLVQQDCVELVHLLQTMDDLLQGSQAHLVIAKVLLQVPERGGEGTLVLHVLLPTVHGQCARLDDLFYFHFQVFDVAFFVLQLGPVD